MKISELQKIVAAFKRKHGDVEVAYCLHSDISLMDAGEIGSVDGIPNLHGGENWITRAHPKMEPADLERRKLYLLFPGN